MFEIYNLGWLLLPIGIYFIIVSKIWLDKAQLYILVIANLMLVVSWVDGWFMQVTYLFLVGLHSGFVLTLAKSVENPSRDSRYRNANSCILSIISINFQQIILLVIISGLWLCIRIYTHLSPVEEINSFNDLLENLKGWNCTFFQFTFFNGVWLIYLLLAWAAIKYLRNFEANEYKQTLLKYKIMPDVVILLITFLYDVYAYTQAKSVSQCLMFWQGGFMIHPIIYIGVPVSTFIFFYVKGENFKVDEQESQPERPLNQLNIKQINPNNFLAVPSFRQSN